MIPVQRIDLNLGWTVSLVGGSSPISLPDAIPATIPGCVHTDLMAAGLIPDPFLDDNERLLAWIGQCDWEYRSNFDWSAAGGSENVDLVFLGLDTVARVSLNGVELLSTANMHRSHRIAVGQQLKQGSNQLTVRFESPIRYADRMSLELGYRPHVNHHPYNAIRKMACSFGWDWGIDTATSGIWKPVFLERFEARLESVRPVVTLDDAIGNVECHVTLAGSGASRVRATIGDHSIESDLVGHAGSLKLKVTDPELWQPSASADSPSPALYPLRVELIAEGEVIDSWTGRIGFREIEVEFPEEANSVGFQFRVNGRATYIKGVNWIPNDAFVSRITRESLRERLTQAKQANINLIRVWGGGIYESDDFYDLCDELGLMVWQDFPFACASYAEEEPIRGEVIAEARENITRIMPHPSLALWNGNNENLWGYQEWRWEQRLQGKTWGAWYYFDLFPQLIAELDAGRPYTPGSPYSPVSDRRHNDPSYGSVHIWDLWNDKDYPHYRDYSPRFVAEFGWQAPASWSTMRGAIHDDPLTPESPGMIIHQKAMLGNDKLTDGLVHHFELPNSMSDWHWAMQLNQANAIATALSHMKSLYPSCMGSVVWQLNDCWPVTSWAAIDGQGVEKPVYFAIEKQYRNRLAIFVPLSDGIEIRLVNDDAVALAGELLLQRKSIDGRVEAEYKQTFSVPANSTQRIAVPSDLTADSAEADSYLICSGFGDSSYWFFRDYKEQNLQRPKYRLELTSEGNEHRVRVTAETLLRDLTILIDKVDPNARVDSGLLTLEPGQSHEFRVTGLAQLSSQDLAAPGVIRTANELVAG